MDGRGTRLSCPACTATVAEAGTEIRCGGCGLRFPIVAGIPDFRLEYTDSLLTRAEEEAFAVGAAASLREIGADGLVDHWVATGWPEALARRFAGLLRSAPGRAEEYVGAIERYLGRQLAPGDRFLEIGCGSAAISAAAASRGADVVASDASLRSLVVASDRLSAAGSGAVPVVCCSAEEPCFPPEAFDVVVASHVVEHARDQTRFVQACARLVRPGGLLFLATPNRFSLGLEPHVRLWGIGYLPHRVAVRYVAARRRVAYEAIRPLSAGRLRRLLSSAGLEAECVPPAVPESDLAHYRRPERTLVSAYNRFARFRPARPLLLAVGPFFQVFARKPSANGRLAG